MLIRIINNNVYNDLYTRMLIKTIKNLVTQAIKTINNVYKHIKTIKKTLVSRCLPLYQDFRSSLRQQKKKRV